MRTSCEAVAHSAKGKQLFLLLVDPLLETLVSVVLSEAMLKRHLLRSRVGQKPSSMGPSMAMVRQALLHAPKVVEALPWT